MCDNFLKRLVNCAPEVQAEFADKQRRRFINFVDWNGAEARTWSN